MRVLTVGMLPEWNKGGHFEEIASCGSTLVYETGYPNQLTNNQLFEGCWNESNLCCC
jgi:hypothetical protein